MARSFAPTRPRIGDLVAGISVAAILIPQAVAYSSIAGMPATAGLLTAAAAPIAASFFASSPYLATGPVAITSLLVFGALAGLAAPGSESYILLAALLALLVGGIRLLLGLAKGGALAYLMSQPVLVGFTAAAGLLILMSQVPALLGTSSTDASPVTAAFHALAAPSAWDWSALTLGLISIGAMLLVRWLPVAFPLVPLLVAATTALAAVTGIGGPEVASLATEAPPNPLALPWGDVGVLLVPALVIALVGFAEPVAISRRLAAENKQHWSPNRELVSQGAANVAAGLVGGYPVGGSFSRSVLNKLTGAVTRWSGLVSGLVVLAFLPLAFLLTDLPRSVLAGIVIAAVVKLGNPRPVLEFWRLSRVQFGVAAATFVLTLWLAPRIDIAVVIGIGLAIIVHLWREFGLQITSQTEGTTLHVRPRGVLYFASAPSLEQAVNDLIADHPDTERVVIHLAGLGRIDVTGALALRDLLGDVRSSGLHAGLRSIPVQHRRIVDSVLASDVLPEFDD